MLLALSGALALLAGWYSPVLLPYPLLVLAYLRGWRLPLRGPRGWRVLIATLLCTQFLEVCAWLDNYLKNAPEPALFHPQLLPDLITSIGIYAAWGLVWWYLLARYRFTTLQVFLITGLYGVLIEQQGAVFLAGLAALPGGALLWLFVAVAYGATMALAAYLVRDAFGAGRDGWVKYPLALAGLLVVSLATSLLWGLVLAAIPILPPPKLPMRAHPFW